LLKKEMVTDMEITDLNKEIVTTCPEAFVGVRSVFEHGKKLGFWKFLSINKDTEDQIQKFKVIIFGAWTPFYKKIIETLKNKLIIIFLTSTPLQMDSAPVEHEFLQEILKIHDVTIFCGSPFTKRMINHEKCFYVPYPISTMDYPDSKYDKKRSVGLFCPTHFRKNITNQLLAVSVIPNLDEFHTNVPCQLMNPKFFFKYVWLSRNAYLSKINSLKAMLHVSLTESLCYAAVDAILAGTIPIISISIAHNLELLDIDDIIVANHDDPDEIALQTQRMLDLNETQYAHLLAILKSRIDILARRNNNKMEAILKKILDIPRIQL